MKIKMEQVLEQLREMTVQEYAEFYEQYKKEFFERPLANKQENLEEGIRLGNSWGYSEARKLDALISSLLEEKPINKENALAYLNFSRTLQTSCYLIERLAKDALEQKE